MKATVTIGWYVSWRAAMEAAGELHRRARNMGEKKKFAVRKRHVRPGVSARWCVQRIV